MNKFWKRTGIIGMALAVLLGYSLTVEAYAVPIQSSPGVGEVVRKQPGYVMVSFSEPVDPFQSQIEVFDADGRKADRNDCGIDVADPDRKTMVATLKPDLPTGVYTVRWTTIADSGEQDDGYVVQGQFDFTIAPSPYQIFLTGLTAVLAFLFMAGGWVGFGVTYGRLRRYEAAYARSQTIPGQHNRH